MNTPIIDRDLSKQAPHSPRERIGGFAIACRAVDKCRASLAGSLGEYHYDCPLDNQLFSFKGITATSSKPPSRSRKIMTTSAPGCWPTARLRRHRKSRIGRMIRKPAAR